VAGLSAVVGEAARRAIAGRIALSLAFAGDPAAFDADAGAGHPALRAWCAVGGADPERAARDVAFWLGRAAHPPREHA
jgi:hypothetical protein